MNDVKIIDALGQEVNLNKDEFSLVQVDKKIHDVEFETKPTTFIKDAFRRFCKNKASVVGAIIILIIMLSAIFVPIISPYQIEGSRPYEKLLVPKLFEQGSGFWDGTKTYKAQPYDSATGMPSSTNFKKDCIIEVKNVRQEGGIMVCDFVYDEYKSVYGLNEQLVALYDMERYVANGWCTYTYNTTTGEVTFEKLSDECPVEEVTSCDFTGSANAIVTYYKYLGYDEMPKFIFGTDGLGRDCLKFSLNGLRYSFVFAILIAAICFSFGLVWGAVSGYFGGNVDLFMERFKDILGGIPLVVMVTLFRLNFGDSLFVFGCALCITGWMGTSSITRTQFYRFKGREYVLASRTLGSSDKRLIFRHILPNALGTIVTSSVLMIPSLIFTEASLSYLGLGLEGSKSFGAVLSNNQQYIGSYPTLIAFPAVIISLLMISFNLFGNGLRDALNPSLKGSE